MKRTILTACLTAALAISAIGATVQAEAPTNDNNCIGANASSFKSSMGIFASVVFQQGAMADFNHDRKAACGD